MWGVLGFSAMFKFTHSFPVLPCLDPEEQYSEEQYEEVESPSAPVARIVPTTYDTPGQFVDIFGFTEINSGEHLSLSCCSNSTVLLGVCIFWPNSYP